MFPRFPGGRYSNMEVGEHPYSLPEIMVIASEVDRSVDEERGLLRRQNHHVALDVGHLHRSPVLTSESKLSL